MSRERLRNRPQIFGLSLIETQDNVGKRNENASIFLVFLFLSETYVNEKPKVKPLYLS